MTTVNTKSPVPGGPLPEAQQPPPNHFGRLLTGKLAKASGLMFVATIGGGILGYVFQVLMGRMLSVADYGLFVTMMALLSVVGVPLGTLSMVVTRRASYYRAKNQSERVAAMFWWINSRVFWIALTIVLCVLPFTQFLRDYAHLESLVPVWLFLLLNITVLFGPVNVAFLQALQNFHWLAINGLAVQGFKVIFCVALVHTGFKLSGALMGMVLATMATWMLTYLPLRSAVTKTIVMDQPIVHLSSKGVIPVLIANLSFAVMTQLDLLLVNHYYNSYQAGVYAAAASIGKAVMYLPAAITIAMFPMVAENESRSQSSAHLFLNAMMLTAGLSVAGALFYFLFADDVMTVFYGQKYIGASALLKYYGFAMLPMTLVTVGEHFLIAKGRVVFAYVMMIGIPLVLFAAHAYHDQLIDMVYILVVCGWLLVLAGFGVVGVQAWSAKYSKHST